MIVLVKWTEHDRMYSMGLQPFLKKLGIDVDDATIAKTVKNLLEQEELEQSEHQ